MFDPKILATLTLGSLAILLFLAIIIELRTKRIPNWLTLAGILAGLVLAALDQQWTTHLSGLFLGLIFGGILFVYNFAAAGFVKLLIAVGSILGPMVPLITIGLAAFFWMGHFLFDKFKRQPELEHEVEVEVDKEKKSSGLMNGSIVIALITVISLAYLFKPWS